MRPDKIKAVLEVQAPPNDDCLVVHVQPKHKGVWRRDPLRQYLLDVKKVGLPVMVVCGLERFCIGDPWQFRMKSEMHNPDGSIAQVTDYFEDLR
jgi:hypothetical protein